MAKTMLVNVTHVEESRVAILEDGVLEQYEIETINRTNIKGNIHNAVVEKARISATKGTARPLSLPRRKDACTRRCRAAKNTTCACR